jgi:hypothetical protein
MPQFDRQKDKAELCLHLHVADDPNGKETT